jgi:hypothetical protein
MLSAMTVGAETRMRCSMALFAALVLGASLVACSGGTNPTPGSAGSECQPVTAKDAKGAPLELTGEWSANDGGRYRLKQIDSCLIWVGLSHFDNQSVGDSWVTTFRGQIAADRTIKGDFLDVSGTNPGSGTLTLKVDDNPDAFGGLVINATGHTGSPYGGSFWERVRPDQPTNGPDESNAADQSPGESSPAEQNPAESSPAEQSPARSRPARSTPSASPASTSGG